MDKIILDATAGFRMMWFNKNHPNALYIDNREECKPDLLCDWKNLSAFPDEKFKLIVFDPPHYLSGWHNPNIKLNQDYGLLNFETWQSDVKIAFRELWRILKPEGVLLFKWNDHDVKFDKVLKLFPVKPLFGQQVKVSNSKNHPSSTIWFCFMKLADTSLG
jgi:SAM-dependent methyltransferase